MRIAYVNKKFIPLDKAKLPALDRGFLYGDGVFETMRSYGGVIFRLEKHLKRLRKSLKSLSINAKLPDMRKITYELLRRGGLKNAYVKIVVTRGKSRGLLLPRGKMRPTIFIYAKPYAGLPEKVYKKGISTRTAGAVLNEKSKIAGHKTLNCLHNILCRYEAVKKSFDDAILLNARGFVSEASSSNIFLVKGKRLLTPDLDSGCLPGITREEVIRIAKDSLKVSVKACNIKKERLFEADEVFLTNSLSEILPVTKINNRAVGGGPPGIITKKFMELFKNSVKKCCNREQRNEK